MLFCSVGFPMLLLPHLLTPMQALIQSRGFSLVCSLLRTGA